MANIVMQTIGILHHPKIPRTQEVAQELCARLAQEGVCTWSLSAWDEEQIKPLLPQTEMLITLGGDGSILRAARLGLDYGIPIAGVNFGRIGFLAEYQPDQALTCLNDLVHGQYWIEERAVLHAQLLRGDTTLGEHFALNDVVIGRGTVARVVRLRVVIDHMESIRHTADGIIVATPTGSTAYTVAAGGPIADPRVRAMIITPIAPHLSLLGSMLVPDNSVVEITVESDYPALVSMDGQVELSLQSFDTVRVTTSDRVSRFVRTRPKNYFYANLSQRLRL
ncbi:MAG: NAD(+)/NADH kinase [Chloroflexi bacterium]|nr:NAD(+)/NADH kinase [Chloroflexota bacterium]